MFIIPAGEVLIVGAAVVLVLASLQSSISRTWLYVPRFTTPEGAIAGAQVPDYQGLTRNFKNRPHRAGARLITHQSTSHSSALWALATLAILGLLTTMLMMGIAISV